VRGRRKIGRVNAYLLPRKPVSERVNNDDIPKSRTVQFLNISFFRICNLEALHKPSITVLKALILEAKITMSWLRIRRVSLSIVSVKAKSLFSLTYDRGSKRDAVYFGWPIAPRIWAIDKRERDRMRELRAIIGCVQLCAWSPIKLWLPNSVYITYAHDVSNAIFIHSVLNMRKQRLTPRWLRRSVASLLMDSWCTQSTWNKQTPQYM
jgi:hypothetical protein